MQFFEKGKDIINEKINIKKAIKYLANSWYNVTKETIRNCWNKTGILSFSTNKDIDNVTKTYQEIIDTKIARINQIINEFDDFCTFLLKNIINDFF